MKGTPAIYLDRIVDKQHFRTFVYGSNCEKKLVESWEEFESHMESGIWFATLQDAGVSKVVVEDNGLIECGESEEKPQTKLRHKTKSKTKVIPQPVEEVDDTENMLRDDGSVFEVKDGE